MSATGMRNFIINLMRNTDDLHDTMEGLLALAVDARVILENTTPQPGPSEGAWVERRNEWVRRAEALDVREGSLPGTDR